MNMEEEHQIHPNQYFNIFTVEDRYIFEFFVLFLSLLIIFYHFLSFTEAGRVVVNFSEYTKINADAIAKMDKMKTEEELKIKSIFDKAKETGTKQELKRFSVDCNGEVDECSFDYIITYAMPDGSKKTERIHCH